MAIQLLPWDRYWAAYKSICRETNRNFDTFVMFDENNKFNVQGCVEKLREYAAKQTNVFLVLNTPANNPTGYNVRQEEWEIIMAELTSIANNGKNNVVLLLDIAYIDFAAPKAGRFSSCSISCRKTSWYWLRLVCLRVIPCMVIVWAACYVYLLINRKLKIL